MMTCKNALERMLEADPGALAGDGSDPGLAAHLRSCGRCRAVSEALTRELAALDAGLDALTAGIGEREPKGLAFGPRAPQKSMPGVGGRERRSPWRRAWIPLASAAALAGVLLLGQDRAPTPDASVVSGGETRGATVAVRLPEDRGGAVLATGNPEITVVWLYERSER